MERVIDLTEEEVLAANLAALGLPRTAAGAPAEDRVFDTFVELIRERRRLVSYEEVGSQLGYCRSQIALCIRRLIAAGRGSQVRNAANGKNAFLPKVV